MTMRAEHRYNEARRSGPLWLSVNVYWLLSTLVAVIV